ncbi:MAG TPA: NnrU family protein [Vineibacter sp.]|nr:NnrU family protein [Vineibacter sp.]
MSVLSHSITAMALSTLLFVGGHFLLSHVLRRPLLAALGDNGFRVVYSLVAAVGLGWMIWAHKTAPHVALWGDPLWARHLLLLIMLVAVFFFIVGMTSPSPGVVGAETVPMSYDSGLGIHAIVRHPGLWGFALWGVGHLIANGDVATVILAGGIAVLAFGGMLGIDARKSRAFPEAYGRFAAHTSNLPFAALAVGKTRLDWSKIGLWRIALALVVYVVLLFTHRWFIGLSALPV